METDKLKQPDWHSSPSNPPERESDGAEAVWQAVLGDLQLQTTRATFDAWLKDATFLAMEDDTFIVGVPSAYAKDWLDNRLHHIIQSTLESICQRPVDFRVTVRSKAPYDQGHPGPLLSNIEGPGETIPRHTTSTEASDGHLPLDPLLTFDAFIVGSSNRMAHAAAQAVAEQPGQRYNPLFLWGGVGLGKTHLLQAIGHAARAGNFSVVYVSSETFTNDLIKAIRAQSTESFRARYRTTDFLLIDDIQFIAGKESTQEEFFHTFNNLHGARKQIILTSDRPPKALSTLEERLRSRFEGGLIADLQPPGFETRLAILQTRSEMANVFIPDDVSVYVAERVQSNVRELTGALNSVIAHAEVMGVPPSLEVAHIVLNDLTAPLEARTPEEILALVAAEFSLTTETIQKRGRSKAVVLPRQVAMYLIREVTDLSLPQIGEALGGRDHTTVMHGIQKITNQIESDAALRRRVLTLKERLYTQTT